jgi:hypothetical protein
MSAIYDMYKNIDGDEAFLSGVVSTLSDETLNKIIPKYWAVQADVFKSDINNIVSNIKKRLYAYNNSLSDSQNIDYLNFEIEKCDNDFEYIVHSLFDLYKGNHSSNESEYIKEFLQNLKSKLGEIKAIYKIKTPFDEKKTQCICDFYTYIVFEVLFIEYSDYIVMVVLGSDE